MGMLIHWFGRTTAWLDIAALLVPAAERSPPESWLLEDAIEIQA
jgi:hypothetical protein